MALAELFLCLRRINFTPNLFHARLLATFCLTVFLYGLFAVTPGGHGLARKGLPAVFLVIAALIVEYTSKPEKNLPRSNNGIWFYLGTISYSIYLIHNGITERILWHCPFLKDYYFPNKGIPMVLTCVLTTFMLSAIAFRYIEDPFHRLARRLAG
jgi:peptidoglycan/LPS O-acetylase OafA/YrhL